MKTRNIKKEVKSFYESKSLSAEQLAKLESMIESSGEHLAKNRMPWVSSNLWGIATAVAVAASIGFFILFSFSSSPRIGPASWDSVVEEISLNHSKRLSVEYPTSSYVQLHTLMDRLDFTLPNPMRLDSSVWQLLGGALLLYSEQDGRSIKA